MTSEDHESRAYRLVAWVVAKIDEYSVDIPDGCPNCHFLLVNKERYETCPHCGWGPETEPDLTAEEARKEFIKGVFQRDFP